MSTKTKRRVAVVGGARFVTTVAHGLKRRDARTGLINICGAGATAVAMLLERV